MIKLSIRLSKNLLLTLEAIGGRSGIIFAYEAYMKVLITGLSMLFKEYRKYAEYRNYGSFNFLYYTIS